MCYCDVAEHPSHNSKAKELHINPFVAEVTWAKWPKDLSEQRRWTALILRQQNDKTGECQCAEPRMKLSLCYHQFNKKKISADGYRSGDPVYFGITGGASY